MADLFTNTTTEYRIKKMVVNMPIPHVEHLDKRASWLMVDRSVIVRFVLQPRVIDYLLGLTNEEEEQKIEERVPLHKGGFSVKPRFKYWHIW